MSKQCGEIHEAVQAAILRLCRDAASLRAGDEAPALLDVGCWNGAQTMKYAAVLGAKEVHGVEIFDEPISQARLKGIQVSKINLEADQFPFDDNRFDIVICNQVFEHLKQIFLPIDEIWRILKPGGSFILSVPNLASFHNRVMLLFGVQPSSIRVFGPHVRGYTLRALKEFVTTNENFKLEKVAGVGFYPLSPEAGGNLLAGLWKSACHTPVLLLRKNPVVAFISWNQLIASGPTQTVF